MTRLSTASVRIFLISEHFEITNITFVSPLRLTVFPVIPGPLEKGQVRNEALRELRVELSKKHLAGELDGFALYL